MGNIKQFKQVLALIKPSRLRESSRGMQNLLVETESDKGRIINSSAFRRLQQKAQVFPLDTNAAVRTRLTHSIEVSQIGRFLAQKVIEKCEAQHLPYEQLSAFANTIESACLLHDIGNPPFGHLGEAAIKEWATGKSITGDLVEYDGNPQGFRLISFLNGNDHYGMNLTCPLLLSTIKYPWSYKNKPEGAKKVGLFSSDYDNYKIACKKIGWHAGVMFPFARLMEAADDISYSMSDLEDGIEKGIITIRDLQKEFNDTEELIPLDADASISPFISFKTKVIRDTVDEAASIFVQNIDSILAGEDVDLVSIKNPAGNIIKKVKRYARKNIYSDESAEMVELAGRSVIKGLLSHFDALLDEKVNEEDFSFLIENNMEKLKGKGLDFEIRLLRRLPKSYRKHYQYVERGMESARRSHLIVDFISGMTDDYSLETYQFLEGIRVK